MYNPLVQIPLRTKDADWTWQYGDQVEYWFKQAGIVDGQEPMMVFVSLSAGDDSTIEINFWPMKDFKDQVKDMLKSGWVLSEGDVPDFCDVCPECNGEGGHYDDVRLESDQQKDDGSGGQIGWIECKKCNNNGWIIKE